VNLSDARVRLSTRIEGRLLFSPPQTPEDGLVLALHGYAQSPEILLPLVRRLLGPGPAIAALAAPFPMYDRLAADSQTVYHWGTRHHWEETIRIHHDLVLQALDQLPAAGPKVLLGFSQPVGLNYRFAGTHPHAVRGVIGICGGVPSRWEEEPYQVKAALLHIARSEDEFYPVPVVEKFAGRLRHHAADVEFHLLPGQHRFPSQAGPLVEKWLGRLRKEWRRE
jgi:predicted esterase